jgi:hypothetical protein
MVIKSNPLKNGLPDDGTIQITSGLIELANSHIFLAQIIFFYQFNMSKDTLYKTFKN